MTVLAVSRDLLDGDARRSPVNVRVLHLASRTVTVVLLGLTAVAIQMVTGGPASAPQPSEHTASVAAARGTAAPPAVVPAGQTVAAGLDYLERAIRVVDGDLLELRLDNPRGARADLVLRVEVPSGEASAIAALIARMAADGIRDVRIERVDASPVGSRLIIVGWIAPSTEPRPSVDRISEQRDLSVLLADLVAASGAQLRLLETGRVERDGSVQLRADGTFSALTDLLGRLEAAVSAPTRIRSVRIDQARTATSDGQVLEVAFLLRESPATSLGGSLPLGVQQ